MKIYFANVFLFSVSLLLGLESEALEFVLTTHMLSARENLSSCFKNVAESNMCRDCLCKTLYRTLFAWIVNKINEKLNPEDFKKR